MSLKEFEVANKYHLSQWKIEKDSNTNAQISAALADAGVTNKGFLSGKHKRKSNLVKAPKLLIWIQTLTEFQG